MNRPPESWAWPMFWAPHLTIVSPMLAVYYFLLGSCFMAALRPQAFLLRLFVGLAWMMLVGAFFSYGHVSHNRHSTMTLSLLLIIYPFCSWQFIWECARAFVITMYVNCGIWKARGLFEIDLKTWWWEVEKILPFHIANGVIDGSIGSLWSLRFLLDHPNISGLAWIMVILFELAIGAFLFRPKNDFWLGYLLILFHAGTTLFLGVNFLYHLPIILFLFLIVPATLRESKP